MESGAEQHVILTSVGQDAYIGVAGVIEADTVGGRTSDCGVRQPFRKEGVTLSMAAGVQLYFHDGANLWVHGRIVAEGTVDRPVVFRGDRTDRMFDYLPYDNTPSRWGGIRLKATSTDYRLNHVDIHSASYGICVRQLFHGRDETDVGEQRDS